MDYLLASDPSASWPQVAAHFLPPIQNRLSGLPLPSPSLKGLLLSDTGWEDGVPGDSCVQPQLVTTPDGGGLPVGTEADQDGVRPLRPAWLPLLYGPAGLVPAGATILPGTTAAAAANTGLWSRWTSGTRWHPQDAAAGRVHATLFPQVSALEETKRFFCLFCLLSCSILAAF